MSGKKHNGLADMVQRELCMLTYVHTIFLFNETVIDRMELEYLIILMSFSFTFYRQFGIAVTAKTVKIKSTL